MKPWLNISPEFISTSSSVSLWDSSSSLACLPHRCDPQFLSALMMRLRVVYYMPGEEVMRRGDLGRELCLVLHGACHLMEDDKVLRVVRHDVRAHPPSMPVTPPM